MYEFGLDKTVLCFTKVKYPPTPSYYPAFAAPPHFPEMVVRCNPGEGGGVLPYKKLIGMCRWMGSHFHDWSDYNGVAFSIVTRMGSQIFGFLG